MILTTAELAELLHTYYRDAYRIAMVLELDRIKQKHSVVYKINKNHPLCLSIELAGNGAMPIYSISDLAAIWTHTGVHYSCAGVKQRLLEAGIPIQNQGNKGLVYLIHLVEVIGQNSKNKDNVWPKQ